MLIRICCAAALLALCAPAEAQEPTNAPSATMPAPGLLTIRPMVRFDRMSDDPTGAGRQVDELRQMVHAAYGIRPGLVAFAETSFVQQDIDAPGPTNGSEAGLGDSMLGMRYRFFRHDPGPIDTVRLALQAVVRVPTGDDAFSSSSFNPSLGVNLTSIRGRHGFNASANYTFTTGDTNQRLRPGDSLADHLRLTGAYLYRAAPASYADSSEDAWFAQIEVLSDIETNGDASLDIAPGVLYEARRWAGEFSVLLPVADDVDDRLRREVGLAIGVRLLF